MPAMVKEYRCLLISPSDVEEERAALTDCINSWNAHIGRSLGARVELVRWETHSIPDLSGEPQAVLNAQIVDDCDLGIALFWTRLGTKTKEHESGSIEEIHSLVNRGCKVMVYFKTAAIPQNRLDFDQLGKLAEAKERLQKLGIVGNFDNINSLKEQANLHLASSVAELLKKERFNTPEIPSVSPVTMARPDVRVIVKAAVTVGHWDSPKVVMSVEVQNHSPMQVYLGCIYIKTTDGKQLLSKQDSVTGEWQKRRVLNPGQAYALMIGRELLDETGYGIDQLDKAIVFDDIGRVYESSSEQLKSVVEDLLKGV